MGRNTRMSTPTSAKDWKKASQLEDVELPSGNVAAIKRPGMEALFAAGVLPDELTKIALDQMKQVESGPQDHKKKGKPEAPGSIDPKVMEKFLEKEGAISDIFEAFDRVTAMCVVKPRCEFHKRRLVDDEGHQVYEGERQVWEEIPAEDRDEEVVYTDDVDMDDKTFIFNYVVGGTRDLESFREEYGDALATVQPREDVGVSSK
jgi:hypothetical protein